MNIAFVTIPKDCFDCKDFFLKHGIELLKADGNKSFCSQRNDAVRHYSGAIVRIVEIGFDRHGKYMKLCNAILPQLEFQAKFFDYKQ